MAPSARRREDRVVEKVRSVLTAAGFDEAMTLSAVDEASRPGHQPLDHGRAAAEPDAGDPRGGSAADEPGAQPAGRAADERGAVQSRDRAVRDRQGLPARATVNCPTSSGCWRITSGREFARGQGRDRGHRRPRSNPALELEADDADVPLLDPAASCRLQVARRSARLRRPAFAPRGLQRFDLRGPDHRGRGAARRRCSKRPNLVPHYVAAAAVSGRRPAT